MINFAIGIRILREEKAEDQFSSHCPLEREFYYSKTCFTFYKEHSKFKIYVV